MCKIQEHICSCYSETLLLLSFQRWEGQMNDTFIWCVITAVWMIMNDYEAEDWSYLGSCVACLFMNICCKWAHMECVRLSGICSFWSHFLSDPLCMRQLVDSMKCYCKLPVKPTELKWYWKCDQLQYNSSYLQQQVFLFQY